MKNIICVVMLLCLYLPQNAMALACQEHWDPVYIDDCKCFGDICTGSSTFGYRQSGCSGGDDCEQCKTCRTITLQPGEFPPTAATLIEVPCTGDGCLNPGVDCSLDYENEVIVSESYLPCQCLPIIIA